MSEKELKKLYKGSVGKPIGHFRVYINSANTSTSFPIELSQQDFDLLYDIRRGLVAQGASTSIEIEKD